MSPKKPDQKRPSSLECDYRIVRNWNEISKTNYFTQKRGTANPNNIKSHSPITDKWAYTRFARDRLNC